MGTTIHVSDQTADEIHSMKERGDSYDDVLQRILGLDEDDS